MVKRVVKFEGEEGRRAYEMLQSSLAMFRAGSSREDEAWSAMEKLQEIGQVKSGDNPDGIFYEIAPGLDSVAISFLESERDVLLAALSKVEWPTFALGRKKRVVTLLKNAEKIE